MDRNREDIMASKIEKWRDDKSMTSNRIAKLLINDFNKTIFNAPDSVEVISRLENIQDLPLRVKNLEESLVNIINQANGIFKENNDKFNSVGKAFNSMHDQLKESFDRADSKFDKVQKQINIIIDTMLDLVK